MEPSRPTRLVHPVDPARDHVLGAANADFTLVEYGSYACEHCHAAHEVIVNLRNRLGDRLRYVFRHLPLTDRAMATKAAELVEYAAATTGRFWDVHDALMNRSPRFDEADLEQLAGELSLPAREERDPAVRKAADARVREDALGGLDSGARATPTFFINGRRYEGAWDEGALTEALIGSLGHRLQTVLLDFASWAPSTGVLLLITTAIALVVSNTALGPAFLGFWETTLGITAGGHGIALSMLDWVNHGLLTLFFLLVGLEIKREFTVGRLATRRAAILPLAAAVGGMIVPVIIYLSVVPQGPLQTGWGLTTTTDTAFAVALIVFLGHRVPVDLRVFLTAAVVVDDLVAIVLVAVFYTATIALPWLIAAALIIALLAAINRANIYASLPYAALGILLWIALHEAGIHATLAGVVLAMVTPTRPPPNLRALVAQAQLIIQADQSQGHGSQLRHGPSEPALRALDAIHDRLESPASKLLRAVEPWSSYFVLPVFALANAGLVWTTGILDGHGRLVLAIVLGLVIGKPVGILLGSWIAVRSGVATKPESYTWRQLGGAGMLGGIGFTMSLFIAHQAFPTATDFTAAKVAIFMASFIAGALGVSLLYVRPSESRPGEDRGGAGIETARTPIVTGLRDSH